METKTKLEVKTKENQMKTIGQTITKDLIDIHYRCKDIGSLIIITLKFIRGQFVIG
jgi:hypothetical protein